MDPSLIPEGPVKQYVESTSKLADGSSEVAKGSAKLANGSVQLAEKSSELANGASGVASGANQVAGGSVELAEGSLSLAAGAKLLSNSASQALLTAAGSLSSSANSLSGITGINETMLGEYFFSPVKLDRQEVFSVPDYGSNVAPFYLVLSMWVGALITCVMIQPKSSTGTEYSPDINVLNYFCCWKCWKRYCSSPSSAPDIRYRRNLSNSNHASLFPNIIPLYADDLCNYIDTRSAARHCLGKLHSSVNCPLGHWYHYCYRCSNY